MIDPDIYRREIRLALSARRRLPHLHAHHRRVIRAALRRLLDNGFTYKGTL